MKSVSVEQIRQFRLHTHHLDTWYKKTDLECVTGACGLQNSPPGAWEIALHNRIPNFKLDEMKQLLEVGKILLQAWSFRGVPVVFPTSQSDVFLLALKARQGEFWIYTQGIRLALDELRMSLDDLLGLVRQIMPKLDGETIKSKSRLDQTLADWLCPLLPEEKRVTWNKPSMYGNPEKQTVGGAAISFLLRPCALMGFVVFGKREGISPTFTSYKRWIGDPIKADNRPERRLMRKYLHCYGPGSVVGLRRWLGCSPEQAERIWRTALQEIEPVLFSRNVYYILSDDKDLMFSPMQSERHVHLLGGHDPYLGLQDRDVILDNGVQQKQLWQTVSNPGAVLCQGKVAGMWKSSQKAKGLKIDVTLWDDDKALKNDVIDLLEEQAVFRQLKLEKITFLKDQPEKDG